jgi:hypothetical protein
VKYSKQEVQEATQRLRQWIKPGDTVHTILRNVSRSGMQREIGVVLLPRKDGALGPIHPNHSVAVVLGERLGKRDGIIIGGCGMDMGFNLVYSLSHALFRGGFGCIGEGCHSNDHSNWDRDYRPHAAGAVKSWDGEGYHRKPLTWEKPGHVHWHSDGGYALRHNWL